MDRALGVLWNLDDDVLKVIVSTPMKPTTRRGILSIMSSIFDPLGLLAPFTIRAKMIFQDEVRRKLAAAQASNKLVHAQIHHFCDASQTAYAVVTYVRLEHYYGYVHISLLGARARLASNKTTSIPSLELCAATLAAQVDTKIRREMTFILEDSVFWSDSMIVLQYISSTSQRFHTFVANRLGTIHRASSPNQLFWTFPCVKHASYDEEIWLHLRLPYLKSSPHRNPPSIGCRCIS
ncbi:uncharacterized protein LOC122252327 [Penaeus japonicus]|uniref:uncharacterized protein LOC122252327 n=1 Tax=Penaeus japonicus TaxID=27405 RepID=UPI001C711E4D|nr:uncharacterized protein LOC122252327 [Penaeus japonicus]